MNSESAAVCADVYGTSLLFSGNLVSPPNKCAPSVIATHIQDLCAKELNYKVPQESISRCKKYEHNNGKKSVIVTFSNLFVRDKILSNAIQKKRAGLFVNEYLTKNNSRLMYEMRKLKKKFHSSVAVFSRRGVPCYRLEGENEVAKRVFNNDDLNKLHDVLKNRPPPEDGPSQNLRSRNRNSDEQEN